MRAVETVGGRCAPDALGPTLMHEHLLIGWPGWEAYASEDRAVHRERTKICVDRMLELRELGVRTLLDPCPIDLGRDVELMAAVAQESGVRIVCATGLYKEDYGAPAYFKFRAQFGDAVKEMADLFVHELTEGVGSTGIRAGVIKVATGAHKITPYEELVLRAAAAAHLATGAPITT
ncbi:MAG: phosphotriesterase-related protein, partial [Deltaproteobacteria bacterium]